MIQPYYERDFFKKYADVIETYLIPLMESSVHREIMRNIWQLTNKRVSIPRAVKRVLKKHANQFEQLFETEFDGDSEEEDSDQEDDDQDSD